MNAFALRSPFAAVLAIAAVAACVVSACATSGISGIYMANDSGGLQHRTVFYTDSESMFCVVKFSAGNPDSTLDFTVKQTGVYPWCGNTAALDKTPSHLHQTFAVGEVVPGTAVESVVGLQIQPFGIMINFTCNGMCTQNSAGPNGNLCGGPPVFPGKCLPGYAAVGADTCGEGSTCCETEISGNTQSGMMATDLPYPAGTYTCVVQLDGVEVGSTDFTVIYPPTFCPVPPPIDGVPCYQWFPQASKCAGYVPGQECTCAVNGNWSCIAPTGSAG